MAGSHRARRAPRGRSAVPPWAIAVAVVVALVPAAWLTAQRVFDGPATAPSASRTTDLPIPPVSPSGTPTADTPGTPATPTTKPSPTLTRVSPDAPRRITSTGLIDSGFDSATTDLEPGSTSEVARWESRGLPGSPGTDTVYVIGTVFPGRSSAFANLPRLRTGAHVTIRTDRGTLTYTVRSTALEPHGTLRAAPLFTTHLPGRLVLVGIRYAASGDRLGDALVVTAELTGAKQR